MNPYIVLPQVPILNDRESIIITRSTGRRVLHLGCVDSGLLRERFAQHDLMHQKLAVVASELWGVDIDAEGIAFLRSQGFDHLVVGDICRLDELEELRGVDWDLIVASEVVEHLQNPGQFLDSVKKLMIPSRTELIVTVPNAFRVDTLLWLLRGIEYIHPDHNYWFSYQTVTNLFRKNGFEIQQLYVYSFQLYNLFPSKFKRISRPATPEMVSGRMKQPGGLPPLWMKLIVRYFKSLPKRFLVSFLYRCTPFWGDGLIIVSRLAADAPH